MFGVLLLLWDDYLCEESVGHDPGMGWDGWLGMGSGYPCIRRRLKLRDRQYSSKKLQASIFTSSSMNTFPKKLFSELHAARRYDFCHAENKSHMEWDDRHVRVIF